MSLTLASVTNTPEARKLAQAVMNSLELQSASMSSAWTTSELSPAVMQRLVFQAGFGVMLNQVEYAGVVVCTGAELEEIFHRLALGQQEVYPGFCIKGER